MSSALGKRRDSRFLVIQNPPGTQKLGNRFFLVRGISIQKISFEVAEETELWALAPLSDQFPDENSEFH